MYMILVFGTRDEKLLQLLMTVQTETKATFSLQEQLIGLTLSYFITLYIIST